MPPTIILPDFGAEWPFKRTQNPHYNEPLCIANAQWVKSFNLLQGKAQIVFDACDFPLFASLIYPRGDPFFFRCAVDFLEWTFLIDELGDQSDVASCRKLTSGIMDILWCVTSTGFLIAPIARTYVQGPTQRSSSDTDRHRKPDGEVSSHKYPE